MPATDRGSTIDRSTAADLMQRASGRGSAPMQVAAVLVLNGDPSPGQVRSAMAERIRAVPRLRRRLMRTPLGAGRPVWVDDTGFDIGAHLALVRCASPGGENELLELAAEILVRPLPPDRPLWSVTQVSGMPGGRSALVVLVDHVLADGIGGIAVLAQLVDGAVPAGDGGFPEPPPTPTELVTDALRSRMRAIRRLPAGLRLVPVLASTPGRRAPRSSLNRPTGPVRRLGVARADLGAVRMASHLRGGTVNDVVLTAVTGALRELLAGRGESVDRFVVSIPVSVRPPKDGTRLGNAVGVLPVDLPAIAQPLVRLAWIARITRSRKAAGATLPPALVAPVLRAMAATGLFGWYIARQRRVNTLVTNVRGPDQPLSFLGCPVTEIIPVTTTTGNVTVAFAVFSYAGHLTVTVVADPDRCPDLPVLVSMLQSQLDQLTTTTHAGQAGNSRP